MKYKSILLFVILVAIIASVNLVSCHKYKSDGYSEWMVMTEIDSVIYAKARAAYLNDPANAGSADYKIMQFLSRNPYAVLTKAVEKGINYYFACRDDYVVTVYKGLGDEIGKVMEIQVGYDGLPAPYIPRPVKRDTIPY